MEKYQPLISKAMGVQLSARERQNIRDELSNSIYNSDYDLLQAAIQRTENGRTVHGNSFCSELLKKAKEVARDIQREKAFIQKLLDALEIGSCCDTEGNFRKKSIEFDHLSSAILKSKNEYLKTPLATRMIQHAQYISELRIAAVTDDWNKVANIMKLVKAGQNSSGIGSIISRPHQRQVQNGLEVSVTADELECLQKELEDRMLCSNLMKAISNGGITIDGTNKVGESNLEHTVLTVDLENIIREATIHINGSNMTSSRLTKTLYEIAHYVLRMRLALKSMDWDYLKDVIKSLDNYLRANENVLAIRKNATEEEHSFFLKLEIEVENSRAELKYRMTVQRLEESFDEGILSVEQDFDEIVFGEIDEIIDEAVASGYESQYFSDLLISVRYSRNIRSTLKSRKWEKVRMILARATHHAAMYASPNACDVELKVIGTICACNDFWSRQKCAVARFYSSN